MVVVKRAAQDDYETNTTTFGGAQFVLQSFLNSQQSC